MSQETTRTAIYNTLKTISGAGKVYDYRRLSTEWDKFLSLFKNGSEIRGHMIGYNGAASERVSIGPKLTNRRERVHTFTVYGILGLQDSAETEKTAAALAETVCNSLDGLNTQHLKRPCQLDIFEERNFGGVLCHYWEISIEWGEMV